MADATVAVPVSTMLRAETAARELPARESVRVGLVAVDCLLETERAERGEKGHPLAVTVVRHWSATLREYADAARAAAHALAHKHASAHEHTTACRTKPSGRSGMAPAEPSHQPFRPSPSACACTFMTAIASARGRMSVFPTSSCARCMFVSGAALSARVPPSPADSSVPVVARQSRRVLVSPSHREETAANLPHSYSIRTARIRHLRTAHGRH